MINNYILILPRYLWICVRIRAIVSDNLGVQIFGVFAKKNEMTFFAIEPTRKRQRDIGSVLVRHRDVPALIFDPDDIKLARLEPVPQS